MSAIYDEEGHFLRAQLLPRNPDLVLVDSRVIVEAPVRTLIAGMGDALSTMFEARACVRAGKPHFRGGSATLAAVAMAELCYRTLLADGVQALADAKAGRLTPAVEHIIEANTLLSGLGFESAGLAAAHGVHNGLTAAPQSARLHARREGRLRRARAPDARTGLRGDRRRGARILRVGRPAGDPPRDRLRDLSKEMLAKIAARATAPGEVTHNEPFPVTAAMVEAAILEADARGRAFRDRG